MAKRGNGEGSIYRRASDGKWVTAVTSESGRRRVLYGRTQREVQEKRTELLAELELGITESPARLTLAAYLETWTSDTLPMRVKAGNLAVSTLHSYHQTVDHHISPYVGRLRLRALKPADLRRWLSELQDTQQSPRCGKCARARAAAGSRTRCEAHADKTMPLLSVRTVRYAHAVLRAALSDAVNDQLIVRNVAMLVEPPSQQSHELVPLTPEEAGRLLAAAADDRLGVLWLTLLALGLRRGEALALRWTDMDLDAATVRISRSLQRQAGAPDGTGGRGTGQLVETSPKTVASTASLVIPVALVEALRTHQADQRRERLASKVWVDPGLVFTTSIGTHLEPRNVGRAWESLCVKAEVRKLRVHDLRHATATFLLSDGVDMKVIQRQLRHSRHQTTADVYAHVAEKLQRNAADSMDAVLRELGS